MVDRRYCVIYKSVFIYTATNLNNFTMIRKLNSPQSKNNMKIER